jgi:hypothetical protein
MAHAKQSFERALDTSLRDGLKPLGFKRVARLRYCLTTGEAESFLSFPVRLRHDGQYVFSCLVAIRFYAVERLAFGDGATQASIVVPLHLLEGNQHFMEWTFDPENAEPSINDTLHSITRSALPFIGEVSTLQALRQELSKPTPLRIAITEEDRIAVLAAIEFLEGNRSTALSLLNEALDERRSLHPKYSEPLREMLRRMETGDIA